MYCKQQIVQLYFAMLMKSVVREHCLNPGCRRVQITETNCLGYDKEVQEPRNPCHLPGSGWCFKLTPEVLAMIEE